MDYSIDKFDVNCPSLISSEDFLRCDIKVYGYSSDVDLLISYDDKTTEILNLPSFKIWNLK